MSRPIRNVACLLVVGLLSDAFLEAAPPEQPVTVITAKPQRKTMRRLIEATGRLEAAEQTDVSSKIAGFVQKLQVDIGDRVKKGDLLVELAVPELEAELKQKQAVVAQAQVEVEQARRVVKAAEAAVARTTAQVEEVEAALKQAPAGERAEKQARLQTVKAAREESVARRDVAEGEIKVVAARLEVAKTDAERVETLLRYRQVRAPFDGVVYRRNVNIGDLVGGSAEGNKALPLFTLVRIDSVRVVFDVPEVHVASLRVGLPARVSLPALGEQEFTGKLTRMAGALNPETGTLHAEIHLPNAADKLRPGMFARIAITLEEHADVWTLPAQAVIARGRETFCYRVDNGKAVRLPVQTGLKTDDLVEAVKKLTKPAKSGEQAGWKDFTGEEEIITGVVEGDHVVSPSSLADDQPVRVRTPDKPGKEDTPRPAPAPADYEKLAKARVEAARKAYELGLKALEIRIAFSPEQQYLWSRRWLEAEQDLSSKKEDRLAALEAHFQRMQELEKLVTAEVKAGQAVPKDGAAAEFYRTEAELWLAWAKAK